MNKWAGEEAAQGFSYTCGRLFIHYNKGLSVGKLK